MTPSPQLASRIIKTAIALAAVPLIVLVFVARDGGRFADACAEALVAHASSDDRPYLEGAVHSPPMVEALLAAARVELGFVRPESSDWTRVGVFVKPTETATQAQAIVLRLDNGHRTSCKFLRDFEPGPFEP